ncbi:hypothetical protein P280DRAFT_521124 [Massarina eburnea CBS 473.64]|uniref:Uncharacterized protein n=1 Tax=Massarina eburnea CBS 473.64 TaxID=1395130 RepID=A0A6A6RS30_9PLEO|nr:hypothetical protein P280DRAFT_521124 [Massarina eburnea CBS 473.64]
MASLAPPSPPPPACSHTRPQMIFTSNTVSSDPPTPSSVMSSHPSSPIHDLPEAERGRLKRRRMSSHSPPRAPSPSRGHDRDSGSRHRHHHRKHHRADSSDSITPPRSITKNRRRSDAEPDHTLRGRARNRSQSRSQSPICEGEEMGAREARRRDQPPSRGRNGSGEEDDGKMRRQRSLRNIYELERNGDGKRKDGFGVDAQGRLKPVMQV